MIDYSNWDERRVAVTTLQLDPKNPRIPDVVDKSKQRDIIAELDP